MAVPQQVILLTGFMAFVAWNEGVVLGKSAAECEAFNANRRIGDKSNHVATIHIPQMLYIWPYITFFSAPILLPYVFDVISVSTNHGIKKAKLPGYGLIIILTGLAALAVRFNTIVHPFTLADNRHYVFYVFRQLLRNDLTKYGATPIYVLTGWLCIRRLGARPSMVVDSKADKPASSQETPETNALPVVFIWLLTTALSLITAPLVEPRYFIIPWVLWRLLLPSTTRAPADAKPYINKVTGRENGPVAMALKQHDAWLWLETLWFLSINAATGYVFLYKGFTWISEPFSTQRFMW